MTFLIIAVLSGALLCFILQFLMGLFWGTIWFVLIVLTFSFVKWYWRLASICFFTELIYMTSFNTWIKQTRDAYIAHRKTLDVFHARMPFTVLTAMELDQIANKFSKFSVA